MSPNQKQRQQELSKELANAETLLQESQRLQPMLADPQTQQANAALETELQQWIGRMRLEMDELEGLGSLESMPSNPMRGPQSLPPLQPTLPVGLDLANIEQTLISIQTQLNQILKTQGQTATINLSITSGFTPNRRTQIEQELEEQYRLLGETEKLILLTERPLEKARLQYDLDTIRNNISRLEKELTQLPATNDANIIFPPELPPDTRAITWLHLSDLQFRDRGSYNQNRALQNLIREDLPYCRQQFGLQPDLIFLTGNIAYEGRADQYEASKRFLDDLLNETGLDDRKLFIIPGQHDIDGQKISYFNWHFRQQEDFRRLFDDSKERAYREIIMRKFDNFNTFLKEYFGRNARLFDAEKPYATWQTTVQGYKVDILGLNSAIAATPNSKQGEIWIREWQAYQGVMELRRDTDLTISLLHHPLEWLTSEDEPIVRGLLERNCQIILHSNLDQPKPNLTLSSDQRTARIASPPLYIAPSPLQGERAGVRGGAESLSQSNILNKLFGYNFARFSPASGNGTIYLRASDNTGNWTADTKSSANTPAGQWQWAFATNT